jgi:hypothetical protein
LHDVPVPHLLLALIVAAQTLVAGQYRQAGESVETDPQRQLDILDAALAFYRPSGIQSRWIDRALLPTEPDAAAGVLSPTVVEGLVDRLGRGRFCAADARDACRFRQGGRLRVSPPYLSDPQHARVVVQFESVWTYGPSIVSYQTMWLARQEGGWKIVRRGSER